MAFPAPLQRQKDNVTVYETTVPPDSPSINIGLNTCADWLIRLHSCATLTAVKGLSPVIILHARWADRKAWIAGAVPGFSLFSKIIKPRNRRPDSACSLHRYGKSMLNSKDLRNDKKKLTASFSAPSAMTTLRCSFPQLQSHDTRASCSMKGGRHSHQGLVARASLASRRLQNENSSHESTSHISPITSGAPFTYISMLVLRRRLTMTLIRRSCETNSNVRITPNSRKWACCNKCQITRSASWFKKEI